MSWYAYSYALGSVETHRQQAWQRSFKGGDDVLFLADPDGDFAKSLELEIDLSVAKLGLRYPLCFTALVSTHHDQVKEIYHARRRWQDHKASRYRLGSESMQLLTYAVEENPGLSTTTDAEQFLGEL